MAFTCRVCLLFSHLDWLLGLGLLWRWYLWRAQAKYYVDCPSVWVHVRLHTIDSGYLFLAGIPGRHLALLYPVTRCITFDHLTEGVSARFLHIKLLFPPLQWVSILWEVLGDYANILFLIRFSHFSIHWWLLRESIMFKMVANDWTLFLKMLNSGESLLEEAHGFMEETDKLG